MFVDVTESLTEDGLRFQLRVLAGYPQGFGIRDSGFGIRQGFVNRSSVDPRGYTLPAIGCAL